MGERLVVEIRRDNKLIATSYFHWSAYTEPALHILKLIRDHVLINADSMTDEQLKLAMIRFAERNTHLGYFETTAERDKAIQKCRSDNADKPDAVKELIEDLICKHGGLEYCDRAYAQELFPGEEFEVEDISRNEGLVAISNQSMLNQIDWAERIVQVDLSKKTVINEAICEYDKAGYMSEMEEYEYEYYTDPDEIPRSPIDLVEFSLDEIDIVMDVIEISQSDWIKYNDRFYRLIK